MMYKTVVWWWYVIMCYYYYMVLCVIFFFDFDYFYDPWSGDVNQYCTVLIPFGGETGVKKMALLPDKVGARGRC